jgi:hypothetical protein
MEKTYSTEYWLDEDAREAGLGEMMDDFDNEKEAIEFARNVFRKENYACVEVISSDDSEGDYGVIFNISSTGEILSLDREMEKNIQGFKENFTHTSENRGGQGGSNEDAIEFLSKAFAHGDKSKVRVELYKMFADDSNCLSKMSTVFLNGTKGIESATDSEINKDIWRDLMILSAYSGDVTEAYNLNSRVDALDEISNELRKAMRQLDRLDDFNEWLDDADSIEDKALDSTVKVIKKGFSPIK